WTDRYFPKHWCFINKAPSTWTADLLGRMPSAVMRCKSELITQAMWRNRGMSIQRGQWNSFGRKFNCRIYVLKVNFNHEGSVVLSKDVVAKSLFQLLYGIELLTEVLKTIYGNEILTNKVPFANPSHLTNLSSDGVISIELL
ncbi:MAG: hypothetical protein ACTS4W_00950, partial [Candidatus Hodgkinia cicadicola]